MLPWWLRWYRSACNVGDLISIPEPGRSSGEGNGYPFQYSCLENPMERGAWQATIHGFAKSWAWVTNTFTSLHVVFYIPCVIENLYSDILMKCLVYVCVYACSVVSDSFWPSGLTVACQALLSMEFSRQEYWSGLPFPTPGLSCRCLLGLTGLMCY